MNLREGIEKYEVRCRIYRSGEDLIVIVNGGEKDHIGAVSVAIPRKSLEDDKKLSADVSTITIPYHKEDLIAREWAKELSKKTGKVVTVTVGIHIDNAEKFEVDELVNNSKKLLSKVISEIIK